jgi:hypothetical protein
VAWHHKGEVPGDAPPPGASGPECTRLARLGREVFGLPDAITSTAAQVHVPLLRVAGGPASPVAGIPPSVGRASSIGSSFHSLGSVKLGDGTEVLLWDGDGWERGPDGAFQRRWELGADSEQMVDLVPEGPDGFYYLDDRVVHLARRGQKPSEVLPWAENVMRLARGPRGSLLLEFGRNDRSLCLALAFPGEGSFIGLKRKDLESPHVNELFHGFFWDVGHQRLLSIGWGLIVLDEAGALARKPTRPKK